MSGLKVVTFTGTNNSERFDMTVEIPEGGTLILKQARFDINYADDNYPVHVNIAVGSTQSSDFVIDNSPGQNYLKVGLDYGPNTFGGQKRNISVTYPDAGYKISGRINKYCTVSLYNETFAPLTNLHYYFLQFVVI